MKLLQNCQKIAEIQSRLTKYTYLSRNNLPGYSDAVMFETLIKLKKYPNRQFNPNLYYWYILMRQFSINVIQKWINDKLYYDEDDTLIESFQKSSEINPNQHSLLVSTQLQREQNGLQGRSPKNQVGQQTQYIIDVLLKDFNQILLETLKQNLEAYKLTMTMLKQQKLLRLICGYQADERQKIINIISKTLEYENIQIKKIKKSKTKTFQRQAK